MKQEIAQLKTGVNGLAQRMGAVESGLTEVKQTNRRIIATLARLEGKLDDFAETMVSKDFLDQRLSEVYNRIDGLARKVDDMNLRWAVHEDRLSRLERRKS